MLGTGEPKPAMCRGKEKRKEAWAAVGRADLRLCVSELREIPKEGRGGCIGVVEKLQTWPE